MSARTELTHTQTETQRDIQETDRDAQTEDRDTQTGSSCAVCVQWAHSVCQGFCVCVIARNEHWDIPFENESSIIIQKCNWQPLKLEVFSAVFADLVMGNSRLV